MKNKFFYCPICGEKHSIAGIYAARTRTAKSADDYDQCSCGTKLAITLLEQEFIIKQAHIKLINC